MSRSTRIPLVAALALTFAAHAQNPSVSLSYRMSGGASVSVAAGGAIAFGAVAVGSSLSATLSISNIEQDGTAWTIAGMAIGGTGYAAGTVSATRLAPGDTATLPLRFAPTRSGAATGSLTLQFNKGAGADRPIALVLSGSGSTPQFALSYTLAQGGNTISLESNVAIDFPASAVGQAVAAVVIVANKGTVAAAVESANASGSGYRLSGLPVLPFTVQPSTELRFTLTFTPASIGSLPGTLSLGLAGATRVIPLQGIGSGPLFSYSYSSGAIPTSLRAGDTIPFPDIPLGGTTSVVVQVANTGNAAGQVSALTISAANFRVVDAPPLPHTIASGDSMRFNVIFAPQEVGSLAARLTIGSASFNLSGVGTGSKLVYSYGTGESQRTVLPDGVIVFPNTTAGTQSSLSMQIANLGNRPAAIQSIGVSGTGFAASEAPAGIAALEPGGQIAFSIVFAPQSLGTLSGALLVDDKTFVLRGSGSVPATLPATSWTGLTGTVGPLQQPSIGVKLADAYPLDLTGTVALSFNSNSFADDPSIQFASGGRTLGFRIPAKTRDAVFPDGATLAQYQSGSVAGTITLQASFRVATVDVTPAPPPAAAFTIPMSAPVIRSAQVSSRSGNTVNVLISGYCPARAVKQLTFDFTAAPGYTLQSSNVVVDVEPAFSAWYQSTGSVAYGSQFTIAATIGAGDIDALQSVAISAANTYGSSSPVSLQLKP